jgi:hypothetical protein
VSTTPAAVLARLKVRFPAWTIRPVEHGTGYTAHRGEQQIYAPTLAELETHLAEKRLRRH